MLYLGIDYKLCGELNPRLIKPFIKAFEEREKQTDTHSWLLGGYINEATTLAIANCFGKKGSKKRKYRQKPYHEDAHERRIASGAEEMSREERAMKVRKVFEQINATLMTKSPSHRKKEKGEKK